MAPFVRLTLRSIGLVSLPESPPLVARSVRQPRVAGEGHRTNTVTAFSADS